MSNYKYRFFQFLIKHLLVLVCSGFIGTIALLLVFCIPTNKIQEHIGQSVTMLEQDFANEEIIEGYPSTLKGTFTDCLMLHYSVYTSPEHSLLEQVMYMYRTESNTENGWAPGYSLIDYISGNSQNSEIEYSRYWHGYLVVLKPLLYFMNFNVLRILASYIQLLLISWIIILCMQRNEKWLSISFIITLPFLNVPFLYFSLSLSICFYILAFVLIIQLRWNEKILANNWYNWFFCFIGMATSYFDFLTYPLITLCFPLCVFLYLNTDNWKSGIKRVLFHTFEWWFGYLGLWFTKWFLTDILVDGNTIRNALLTISSRTESLSEHSKLTGFIHVLFKNLDAHINPAIFVLLIITCMIILFFIIEQRKYGFSKEALQTLYVSAVICIIAFYPLIWFFITQNHSSEHWMFTCKILSICIFSLACSVGKIQITLKAQQH